MEGGPAMGDWLLVGIRLGELMPECLCCLEEVKDGSRDRQKARYNQNMRLLGSRRAEQEKGAVRTVLLGWFLFAARLDAALPPLAHGYTCNLWFTRAGKPRGNFKDPL